MYRITRLATPKFMYANDADEEDELEASEDLTKSLVENQKADDSITEK